MKRRLILITFAVLGAAAIVLGIKLGMLTVIHGFASQI